MSPDELAIACARSVNFHTEAGWDPAQATVMITTPAGWKAPPRFPRGTIVRVTDAGERVRYLPALRLLAWLAGNKLIQVNFPKDDLKTA